MKVKITFELDIQDTDECAKMNKIIAAAREAGVTTAETTAKPAPAAAPTKPAPAPAPAPAPGLLQLLRSLHSLPRLQQPPRPRRLVAQLSSSTYRPRPSSASRRLTVR